MRVEEQEKIHGPTGGHPRMFRLYKHDNGDVILMGTKDGFNWFEYAKMPGDVKPVAQVRFFLSGPIEDER